MTPAPTIRCEILTTEHCWYLEKILQERWELTDDEAHKTTQHYLYQRQQSRCWILTKNNQPIGTGIFDTQNNVGVPYSPWLLGLFVEPNERGHNHGERLTAVRLEYARKLGYQQIYLDTDNAQEYHQKRGWRYIGNGTYHGEPTAIMQHSL